MAGTSQLAVRGFLGYGIESSFAAASVAYSNTLRIRDGLIDLAGLSQSMVRRGGVFGRPNNMDNHIPGPHQGATLTFTMDLYGHGSSTDGSLTQTQLVELLAHGVGNGEADQVGGALTSGGHTATSIVSTNTTFEAGDLLRVGTLNDSGGEGQGTVAADGTSAYDLLVALPAAPSDGDIARAMQMVYPCDDSTDAHVVSSGAARNNSMRFIAATATQQYSLVGGALSGIAISGLNVGEVPSIQLTYSFAYWYAIDITFPSSTAPTDHAPAPCCNGSLFYNAVGTATRNTDVIRNFGLSIDHQMIPIMGQGGANANQIITGWVRGKSMPVINFGVEAEDATTTPEWSDYWATDPNSIVNKHLLYTASVVDGRAVAFYFPKIIPSGDRPTQVDVEGLTYVPVQFDGVQGPTATTSKTRSAWRMGLG